MPPEGVEVGSLPSGMTAMFVFRRRRWRRNALDCLRPLVLRTRVVLRHPALGADLLHLERAFHLLLAYGLHPFRSYRRNRNRRFLFVFLVVDVVAGFWHGAY